MRGAFSSNHAPPGFPYPIYAKKTEKLGENKEVWLTKKAVQNLRSNRNKGMFTIFVGNLFWKITEEALKKIFRRYENIIGCRIYKGRKNLFIKYAFLKFEKKEDAEEARKFMNSRRIMNSRLRVEYARRELWTVEERKNKKKKTSDIGVERSQNTNVAEQRQVQGVLNEEVKNRLGKSWILISKKFKSLKDIKGEIENIEVKVVAMIRWGFQGVIVICANDEESQKLDKRKESISDDFVKVTNMEEEVEEYRRYTWIACRGIPVIAWSRLTMDRIATLWGKLLALKEDTETLKEMEVAYLLIQTSNVKEIDEIIDLNFESRSFSVRVREVLLDDEDLEEYHSKKMIDEDISPKKLSNHSQENLNGCPSDDLILGNDHEDLVADLRGEKCVKSSQDLGVCQKLFGDSNNQEARSPFIYKEDVIVQAKLLMPENEDLQVKEARRKEKKNKKDKKKKGKLGVKFKKFIADLQSD